MTNKSIEFNKFRKASESLKILVAAAKKLHKDERVRDDRVSNFLAKVRGTEKLLKEMSSENFREFQHSTSTAEYQLIQAIMTSCRNEDGNRYKREEILQIGRQELGISDEGTIIEFKPRNK